MDAKLLDDKNITEQIETYGAKFNAKNDIFQIPPPGGTDAAKSESLVS
jgi:hypothetical protein